MPPLWGGVLCTADPWFLNACQGASGTGMAIALGSYPISTVRMWNGTNDELSSQWRSYQPHCSLLCSPKPLLWVDAYRVIARGGSSDEGVSPSISGFESGQMTRWKLVNVRVVPDPLEQNLVILSTHPSPCEIESGQAVRIYSVQRKTK